MLSRLISAIVGAIVRVLGPKRDDPKRSPAPPKAASTPPSPGPRRDDPR